MRAEIKIIVCPDTDDVQTFVPVDANNWSLFMQVLAGPAGGEGMESFGIVVCTARAFALAVGLDHPPPHAPGEMVFADRAAFWANSAMTGYLIVDRYDWPAIRNLLFASFEAVEGPSWDEVALALSRIAGWEFEDYDQPRSASFPGGSRPLPSVFRLLGPPPPEVHSG